MRRIFRFFREGLWEVDLRDFAWPKRFAFALLRVIAHTISAHASHLVGIRASGLTLVTLLAIVPLAAVVFAIAGAFGFRDTLEQALQNNTQDLPEHLSSAVAQIQELVQRTNLKALGGIGTVLLFGTGLTMFTRVEESLNYAWRARGTRAWLRRMTSFIALVVLVPVLMLGALAITSALSSEAFLEQLRTDVPWLVSIYEAGLWLVPHVMAWIAMTAVYLFMPSADVEWKPAAVSGVLAGSALLGMHEVYVDFQVGVARANAIYATLAALPLLLIYLQLAWTIVLLGAEVGYAVQNLHLIGPGRDPDSLPFATRERIALRLVERSVESLESGRGPLSLAQESQQVDLPHEWLDAVAADLERSGLLARTTDGAVLPARPPESIALAHVEAALRGEVPPRLRSRIGLSAPLAEALDELEGACAAVGSHVFAPATNTQ